MAYTPTKIVIANKGRLTESSDLSQTLGSFIGRKAYLVLTKVSTKTTYVISIGRIVNSVRGLSYTAPLSSAFSNLLTDLFVATYESQTVPIKTGGDLYTKRLRVLNPQAYKDYAVSYTSIQSPDIKDDVARKGYLDDLVITASDDLSNVLVAVNGVFHRTVYQADHNRVFVLDGFRTMRLSSRKDVTLIDTRDVGGHTIVPITAANTTKPAWGENSVVTLPDSVIGKTLFCVIDGYFYHRDDDILEYADDKHLRIRANRLLLIEQFRHNPRTIYTADRYGTQLGQGSRKYNDAFDAVFLNNRSYPTALLKTADFQYSRVTNYHSFVVVMNNPSLFCVTKDILSTGTPQYYEDPTSTSISGMLRYGCGLCPSYGIWETEGRRKIIFIGEQDYDIDRQDQTIAPLIVPSLIREVGPGSLLPAKMFDYVSS